MVNGNELHGLHLPTPDLTDIPHPTNDEPSFEFRSLVLRGLQRLIQRQCPVLVHFPTRWNSSSLIIKACLHVNDVMHTPVQDIRPAQET